MTGVGVKKKCADPRQNKKSLTREIKNGHFPANIRKSYSPKKVKRSVGPHPLSPGNPGVGLQRPHNSDVRVPRWP